MSTSSANSLIKSRFHQVIAESVYNEILTESSKYYHYFGQTTLYESVDELPEANLEYEAEVRNNIIAIKRMTADNVSFIVERNDWVIGTVYNKVNIGNDETLDNFYVMNDQFSVYKCIDNFNAPGYIGSIIKPTGTDLDVFELIDGYKWKFMYNLPLALRNKFLTPEFMPVLTALTSRFYTNGEIDKIVISNGGSGYLLENTFLSVQGDGVNCILTPIIQGGKITSVIINQVGTGYTVSEIVVSSLSGSGAKIHADMSLGKLTNPLSITESLTTPGTVDSIDILTNSIGFTVTPTVEVVGDGEGAVVRAEMFADTIRRLVVVDSGSGYSYANLVLTNTGTAGDLEFRVNVSPRYGHGRNAIRELYSNKLMMYNTINNESISGLSINNDYRQFGLIRNPRTLEYSSVIPDQAKRGQFQVLVNSVVTNINIDDHIMDSSDNVYRVIAKEVSTATGRSGFIVKSITSGGTIVPGNVLRKANLINGVGIPVNPASSFTANTNSENLGTVNGRFVTSCIFVTATFNLAEFTVDNNETDIILVGDGKSYILVASAPGIALILPMDSGMPKFMDTLTKVDSTATMVINNVTPPNFDKHSGDILFIENSPAFFQTEDQAVAFRTVLNF
jgi:hypothetical protein